MPKIFLFLNLVELHQKLFLIFSHEFLSRLSQQFFMENLNQKFNLHILTISSRNIKLDRNLNNGQKVDKKSPKISQKRELISANRSEEISTEFKQLFMSFTRDDRWILFWYRKTQQLLCFCAERLQLIQAIKIHYKVFTFVFTSNFNLPPTSTSFFLIEKKILLFISYFSFNSNFGRFFRIFKFQWLNFFLCALLLLGNLVNLFWWFELIKLNWQWLYTYPKEANVDKF